MFKTLFSKQRLPNPHPTPKPQLSQLQLSDLTPNPLQPFSCNQCNYKRTRAIHLKGHMFTHNGQRPFICNQYSYTCTIAISLKRHMLTHSGEKPFSFNERDYKCTQASDLKTHRFTHTGKKLFLPANSLIIPPHNLAICRVESAEGATCAAIQGQLGSPVNQH